MNKQKHESRHLKWIITSCLFFAMVCTAIVTCFVTVSCSSSPKSSEIMALGQGELSGYHGAEGTAEYVAYDNVGNKIESDNTWELDPINPGFPTDDIIIDSITGTLTWSSVAPEGVYEFNVKCTHESLTPIPKHVELKILESPIDNTRIIVSGQTLINSKSPAGAVTYNATDKLGGTIFNPNWDVNPKNFTGGSTANINNNGLFTWQLGTSIDTISQNFTITCAATNYTSGTLTISLNVSPEEPTRIVVSGLETIMSGYLGGNTTYVACDNLGKPLPGAPKWDIDDNEDGKITLSNSGELSWTSGLDWNQTYPLTITCSLFTPGLIAGTLNVNLIIGSPVPPVEDALAIDEAITTNNDLHKADAGVFVDNGTPVYPAGTDDNTLFDVHNKFLDLKAYASSKAYTGKKFIIKGTIDFGILIAPDQDVNLYGLPQNGNPSINIEQAFGTGNGDTNLVGILVGSTAKSSSSFSKELYIDPSVWIRVVSTDDTPNDISKGFYAYGMVFGGTTSTAKLIINPYVEATSKSAVMGIRFWGGRSPMTPGDRASLKGIIIIDGIFKITLAIQTKSNIGSDSVWYAFGTRFTNVNIDGTIYIAGIYSVSSNWELKALYFNLSTTSSDTKIYIYATFSLATLTGGCTGEPSGCVCGMMRFTDCELEGTVNISGIFFQTSNTDCSGPVDFAGSNTGQGFVLSIKNVTCVFEYWNEKVGNATWNSGPTFNYEGNKFSYAGTLDMSDDAKFFSSTLNIYSEYIPPRNNHTSTYTWNNKVCHVDVVDNPTEGDWDLDEIQINDNGNHFWTNKFVQAQQQSDCITANKLYSDHLTYYIQHHLTSIANVWLDDLANQLVIQ